MLQVAVLEAPVEAAAEALGRLGRVLGDVAGHLLGRQLPGLFVAGGDIADVELRAPTGIPIRPVEGWAGHPDSGHSLAQCLLEEGGGEALGRGSKTAGATAVRGCIHADHGVEVDRPALLELGHLGVGDPHESA